MYKFLLWIIFSILSIGAVEAKVEASRYDSFWVWSGVFTQPVLSSAKNIYILQGEIGSSRKGSKNTIDIVAQRTATPRLGARSVWVVYRTDTLHWPDAVYEKIFAHLSRWELSDNRVVGVQIDFDARTRFLSEYKDFLKNFRQRLPANYQLSITGLMDWGNHADPALISELTGIVDEVVVQTYQGRHTIPNYRLYISRLSKMKIPFKIGIVQGGEWEGAQALETSSWFRGYVVFLLNSKLTDQDGFR